MGTLIDADAERKLLVILAEESRIMQAPRARALMDSLGLRQDDFGDLLARRVFEAFGHELAQGRALVREALVPELVRNSNGRAKASDFAPFFIPTSISTSEETKALAHALKGLGARRRAFEHARRIAALAETGEASGLELAGEFREAAKVVPGYESVWKSGAVHVATAEQRIRDVNDGALKPNVSTGYSQLDQATEGMQPTLCVFIGRGGAVKSGLFAGILRNIARRGERAALFSAEDRGAWLGFRYLADESGVPQGVLRNRKLTEPQWMDVGAVSPRVRGWADRLRVDDRAKPAPAEVLAGAREAFESGCCLAALDNLAAVRWTRGPRMDLEIASFLEDGRALGDEYQRPFVVIAHTHNRPGMKPGDIPAIADCREAPGAIENTARWVVGVAKDPAEAWINVGVLKSQNGQPGLKVQVQFNPISGLAEAP